MVEKDKDFYVRTVVRCLNNTCILRKSNISLTYKIMEEMFPNSWTAINRLYSHMDSQDFLEVELQTFDSPMYVYEVVSKFLPSEKRILLNISEQSMTKDYQPICLDNCKACVRRLDLIMVTFLLIDEIILQPITESNIFCSPQELFVYGESVTFRISKYPKEIYVSIQLEGAVDLRYSILV